ncbi:uncharacterized protein LY89DRAFT_740580 [Mollisia scopiformis]|uniref:Uncharacterized protein n=1 Tax=Mollisia scopiformis TaxID=149040 RepID=A0A132BES7_MOLSC|nr:uncharacterized protein LY89DRAFT_740580 [Mollisia scopiformis]KUJ10187.1 hypothetical protein LY89DRAFT_740580 [Mollisia scopiformis]
MSSKAMEVSRDVEKGLQTLRQLSIDEVERDLERQRMDAVSAYDKESDDLRRVLVHMPTEQIRLKVLALFTSCTKLDIKLLAVMRRNLYGADEALPSPEFKAPNGRKVSVYDVEEVVRIAEDSGYRSQDVEKNKLAAGKMLELLTSRKMI